MTLLLEWKEKIKSFYGKYDIYLQPLLKFIVALITFSVINSNLGFMSRISSLSVALILALLCAIMPINAMLLLSAVMILLQLFSLSLEVAVTAFILFLIMFFFYFRFAPKDGYKALLTPLCFHFHIGPVMPLATGLLGEVYSVIPVSCGIVIYYFLNGVKNNAALLSEAAEDDIATSKFVMTWNQIFGNKEMYLVLITFVLVTLLVLFIRRKSIDHAWSVAIIIGALVNFIVLFAGFLLLGISGKTIWVLIGTIVSMIIAFVLEFMFFNLNYTRTERVQFEDDEYYYYVKAVPKMIVSGSNKQVKKFSSKQNKEELDIDEDMF